LYIQWFQEDIGWVLGIIFGGSILSNNLHLVSQNTLSILANATTRVPGFNSSSHHIASLAFTNIGIPLTGSISMGFVIGFMRG
jgi:hypothetical protein